MSGTITVSLGRAELDIRQRREVASIHGAGGTDN